MYSLRQATLVELPQHLFRRLVALIAVSVLVAIGLATGLTILHVRSDQRQQAERVLQQYMLVRDTLVNTLDQLNQYPFTDCTTITLQVMRQVVLESLFPMDIGFVKDQRLVCTTSKGKLNAPVETPPPDYVSNRHHKIWLNQKVPEILSSRSDILMHYIENEHYRIMIPADRLKVPESLRFIWTVERSSSESSAEKSLLGANSLDLSAMKTQMGLSFRECRNPADAICVTVFAPARQIWADYRIDWFFGGVFVLAAAVMTYLMFLWFVVTNSSMLARVRRGLTSDAFYWLYQPIVDLKTREVVGCEALARFKDAYGVLTPDVFIPVLKQKGLTWAFTERMFQCVCADFKTGQALPDNFKLSFNLLPVDIVVANMQTIVQMECFQHSRFQLAFEIVEDERLEYDSARQAIRVLIDAGHQISIDDFGVGYSNLGHLKRLHCRNLKIDRTFVRDMETEGIKSSLIPHITQIARDLNLHIIAEGIETEMQAQLLRNLNVGFGQGWHFGKPMTVAELVDCVTQPVSLNKHVLVNVGS